tara:strand:+ start:351 stop:734 length:384 start_codon:yes stop_codon:yes gene_type:complete
MSGNVQSINIISKHVEDTETYYADFAPLLGTGETLSAVVSVTPSDSTLTASSPAVLSVDTTDTRTVRDADGNTTTLLYVITANKGVSFVLAGGATGAGSSVVTVKATKSTGKTATLDCLITIKGVDV